MTQIVSGLIGENGSANDWLGRIPVLGIVVTEPENLAYLTASDDLPRPSLIRHDDFLKEEWHNGDETVELVGRVEIPNRVEVGGLSVHFPAPDQGDESGAAKIGFSIEFPQMPLLKFLSAWVIDKYNLEEEDVKSYLRNSGSVDLGDDVTEVLKDLKEAGLNSDLVADPGTIQNSLNWNDPQLKLGPVDPEFEVPKHWLRKGELVKENDTVTGVEPAESEQVSVNLTGVSFVLSSDSVDIELDDDVDGVANQIVENSPPLLIADTGVAFRLKEATFANELPSSDRPSNGPENWRGLVIEKLEVWGLNRLLPFLPEKRADKDDEQISGLTLEDWAVNSDGIWGNAEINFSDDNGTVRPKSVKFSYAGEWWPETFSVTGCLDAGGLVEQQEHLLDFVGDLRLTPPPKETDSDGWSMEFTLSGTAQSDGAIVSLSELSDLGGSLGDLIKLASSDSGDRGRKSDATLVLGAFESLDGEEDDEGLIEFNELALDGITAQVRQRTSSNGTNGEETYRELNVNLDVRADCTLQLQDAIDSELFEGEIEGIPLEFAAGDIPVSYNLDAPQLPDLPDLPEFGFAESLVDGEGAGWSFADGLSLSIPGTVDLAGMVTLAEVDLRGLHKSVDAPNVDIDGIDGLKMSFGVDSSGSGDVAVGGLPDVIDVIYYPQVEGVGVEDVDFPGFGIDVQVGRVGQPVSLLVPGALYAQGELSTTAKGFEEIFPDLDLNESTLLDAEWGNLLAGRIEAFLVGNGGALDAPKMRSSYNFDLELDILSATRDDGLQLFILNLQSSFEPGLPLGTSGAAVYGLGLLFAQNGKPDRRKADDDDDDKLSYGDWYLEKPQYATAAQKWRPAPDHWGFGASTILGSSMDSGRSWNVSAGLILLVPGPKILVTGRGNLFSKRSKLPAEGGDAQDISAPFAAILALDFQRNRFSADLEADFEVGDGGKVLDAEIPATVRVDLNDPSRFLSALGKAELDDPPVQTPQKKEQFRGRVFDLIDVNAFLLLSGKNVELQNERFDPKPTLPGIALAYGAAGSLEWDFSADPLSVALWAHAGFVVGASMTTPLLAGLVWIDGGVEVTAFGIGASMEASIELNALISDPEPFQLDGEVHVALGLPWPMSDIEMNADLLIGEKATWLNDAPSPESPLESVSIWDRGVGDPLVLPANGEPSSEHERVPLDCVIDINFSTPVGNESPQLGSFQVNGEDKEAKVLEVASTDKAGDEEVKRGYRHRIEKCTLKKKKEDGTYEKVHPQSFSDSDDSWPAFWKAGTEKGTAAGSEGETTEGGQPARTRLRLMGPLAGSVAGRIGRGEEMTRNTWEKWKPCARGNVLQKRGGTHLYSTVESDDWDVGALESGAEWSLPNQTPPLEISARLFIEPSPPELITVRRQTGLKKAGARVVKNPVSRSSDPRVGAPFYVDRPPEKGEPLLDVPKLLLPPPVDPEASEASIDINVENPSSDPLVVAAEEILGRARIDIPESTRTSIRLLVADDNINVVPLCWALRPDETEELLPVSSEHSVQDSPFTIKEFESEKPVTELYLAAVSFDFHPNLTSSANSDQLPVASLLDVRCRSNRLAGYAEALDSSREATIGVISRLVEQRTEWASGGDAGLLEPDTTYKLTVTGKSFPAKMNERGPGQPQVNSGNGRSWSKEFEFQTEAAPPTDLKANDGEAVRPPAVDEQDDGDGIHRLAETESMDARWEVATTPADGAKAYYLPDEETTPVTVRLREARTLAVFRAFDRKLELRVIDENGKSLGDGKEIDFNMVRARDLLGPQEAMRGHLQNQDCFTRNDINLDSLRREALADVTRELEANARYVAELRAVDGEKKSTLHRWRFQTSRYTGLKNHLNSHVPLDELVPNTHDRLDELDSEGSTVQEALRNRVPRLPDNLTVNDELLDELLFDLLGLPPRQPPSEPEMVTVWAWQPDEETATPVALVLDGPEPLFRSSSNGEANVSLEIIVESAAAPNIDVTTKVVTGQSRGRALLLVEWSDQAPIDNVVEFPATDYRLTVTSRGNKAVKEFSIFESPLKRNGSR